MWIYQFQDERVVGERDLGNLRRTLVGESAGSYPPNLHSGGYLAHYFFTPLPFIYPTPRLQWGAKQHSKWVRRLIRIESRSFEPKAPRAGEGKRLDS